MQLLSLNDSIDLSPDQYTKYFYDYINPELLNIYKYLGTAELDIKSAEGLEILLNNGNIILDFTSALGVAGLGHNHPRILDAEKICHDEKIIDAIKVAPHKLQAALAYNLAQFLPDPLCVSFFAISGAEANEGAMKLCEKVKGKNKNKFITTTGGYHGKTHGSISLTMHGASRNNFIMGVLPENIIEVPFGDINALEEVLKKYNKKLIALILEPIQGQEINVPPKGYLKKAVNICHSYDTLVIFDEIKSGMGKTGKFCAFQHENVIPDVVTLSKALGGGKRAISAFVTTKHLFRRAYGTKKESNMHSTTFGGLGESCAVAIETLNLLNEENLIDDANIKGKYLKDGLLDLMEKYPRLIKEIKGRGLFLGIRFNYDKQLIKKFISKTGTSLDETIDSLYITSILTEYYRSHNILTFFATNDILQVMPSLIVSYKQLDKFIYATDQVLKMGLNHLVINFIRYNLLKK